MRKAAPIIVGLLALAGLLLYSGEKQRSPEEGNSPAPRAEEGVLVRIISVEEETPLYKISAEYPQFPDLPAGFNGEIREYAERSIAGFKEITAEGWRARQEYLPPAARGEFPDAPFYLSARWSSEQVNERFVSLILRISAFDGGASTREDLATFNYDLRAGRPVRLADLFPDDPDYLETISRRAREQLALNLGTDEAAQSMIEAGTDPEEENFKNFLFGEDEVIIYFPKYQVAPGAAGEQRVILSR